MTESIVNFISKDLLPVDSVAFKEVMKTAQPAYTVPSHRHLCLNLLPERYESLHKDLISKLQQAPGVIVTLDLWSSRDTRAFIGVTAHCIVEFKMVTELLACRRFHGSHTGEAILEFFEEIIDEFQISSSILSTITDSASNIVKAFSLPGYNSNYSSANSDDDEDYDMEAKPYICE